MVTASRPISLASSSNFPESWSATGCGGRGKQSLFLINGESPDLFARSIRQVYSPGLFDGHGEPTDQPCKFIQLSGIVVRDGLCEAEQAFIIAHQRDVAGDDGWHSLCEVDIWHLVIPWRR